MKLRKGTRSRTRILESRIQNPDINYNLNGKGTSSRIFVMVWIRFSTLNFIFRQSSDDTAFIITIILMVVIVEYAIYLPVTEMAWKGRALQREHYKLQNTSK